MQDKNHLKKSNYSIGTSRQVSYLDLFLTQICKNQAKRIQVICLLRIQFQSTLLNSDTTTINTVQDKSPSACVFQHHHHKLYKKFLELFACKSDSDRDGLKIIESARPAHLSNLNPQLVNYSRSIQVIFITYYHYKLKFLNKFSWYRRLYNKYSPYALGTVAPYLIQTISFCFLVSHTKSQNHQQACTLRSQILQMNFYNWCQFLKLFISDGALKTILQNFIDHPDRLFLIPGNFLTIKNQVSFMKYLFHFHMSFNLPTHPKLRCILFNFETFSNY